MMMVMMMMVLTISKNKKSVMEAVAQMCSVKKVFLEISQNLQENICGRVSFLIKLLKRRLCHRYFPVNFKKFLRTPFSQSNSSGCFWCYRKERAILKTKLNSTNRIEEINILTIPVTDLIFPKTKEEEE